ncbi:sterol desaturase family protein, partial [Glaesserella parasuis]|uniref:sterol desaturase family protein n=1 Tax=Glaesserella parasuis TaxID=738 RepID=UPI003B78B731
MVALHQRYHHRQPVTAKTRLMGDDLLVCVLGGVYTWLDVVLVLVFVLPAMNWVHTHHRLTSIELTPLSFAALYLGVEFCYYWFHRASHRIRWFWCAHVVHHGS